MPITPLLFIRLGHFVSAIGINDISFDVWQLKGLLVDACRGAEEVPMCTRYLRFCTVFEETAFTVRDLAGHREWVSPLLPLLH